MRWYLPFLLLAWSSSLYAQSFRTLKREGDRYFKAGFYELAIERYEECFRKRPTAYEAHFNLAISYLFTNRLTEAEVIFKTIYEKRKGAFPNVSFYLGYLYHRRGRFRKAAAMYKDFLANNAYSPYYDLVKARLRHCESGIVLSAKPPIAGVERLPAPINSNWNDLHPVYSPTAGRARIYFSSDRDNVLGGLRDRYGRRDNEHGHRNADMFVAEKAAGEYTVKRLSGLLNTSLYDEITGFSSDGKIMYYKKGYTQYSGLLYEDHYGASDKERLSGQLSEVPFDMQKGDATPYFYMDSVVLFASRRLGGFGGYDLYRSVKTPGGWSEPENLGPEINGPYDEKCPFLTHNGRGLYFSSNRPESMGGFDIFKSTYNPITDHWSPPANQGIPINSPDDDLYFSLAEDGWHFLLSSNRVEGFGRHDIYEGRFFEAQPDHLVMAEAGEAEMPADTQACRDAQVLVQHYDLGVIVPDSSRFAQLHGLTEMVNAHPDARLSLKMVRVFDGDKVDYVQGLDPLSVVLVAFFNSNLAHPVIYSVQLLPPDDLPMPGGILTGRMFYREDTIAVHTYGRPALAAGLKQEFSKRHYRVEVRPDPEKDAAFILKNKYDLTYQVMAGQYDEIHVFFGKFLTRETAEQWMDELERHGIRTNGVVAFYGDFPLSDGRDRPCATEPANPD